MASQAHLTVVAAPDAPPRLKPHNTNRGRKFPPEPISNEEFSRLLAACVPLTPGRLGELSAMHGRSVMRPT